MCCSITLESPAHSSLTHCCCFYSLVGKLFCHEELPWTKHSNSSLSDRFCIKRNKSSKKDFFDVVPRLPNHQSDPKEFIHWVNLFYFSVFAFFITLKCFTSADQRGYLAQIKRLVRLIKFVKASVKFPPLLFNGPYRDRDLFELTFMQIFEFSTTKTRLFRGMSIHSLN